MRIGKDGYDVPTYNPEEEEQLKLREKVDKWWYGLDDWYKFELLEGYFEGEPTLVGVDATWEVLDWNDKWDIYTDEKDEV